MPSPSKTNIATFFSAYILSAFGYEFVFFLMTIYVYDKTHSALNVGVFAALCFFACRGRVKASGGVLIP